MIKVLYFARIKEALGKAEESIPFSEEVSSVNNLLQVLAKRGANWQTTLLHEKVLVAVNQEVCPLTQTLKVGDEVAFFPPVTGG